jgi:hypothetical protein
LVLHFDTDKSIPTGEAPIPAPIEAEALVNLGSKTFEKSNPYPIETSRPTSNPASALYSISPSSGLAV